MKYHFFDSASTSRCCAAAVQLVQRFAAEDFGNPSSSHALGQQAAKTIRESRLFFAKTFKVNPEQIIFTGSGTESDNLGIYGVSLQALSKKQTGFRVLCSSTEHPAVKKTVQSLSAFGIETKLIPVDSSGQIQREQLLDLLTPNTLLVSIHQVNNITGAVLPVEELAALVKEKVPTALFHTDAVQAFCKVKVPTNPSAVDLVSISAHKINGPKGIGALIVLNKKLLQNGIRPLIWGGEQEGGMRSGTQNAGLIAGFHAAAEEMLSGHAGYVEKMQALRTRFAELLKTKNLLADSANRKAPLHWNSPVNAVPQIVSLSVPGHPSGPLAKLLEERGYLISTGSACSSQKADPDPTLSAMGLPSTLASSALRVSFSELNSVEEVQGLVDALEQSIQHMSKLLGGRR